MSAQSYKSSFGEIHVVNARVHNLKGISCTIPKGRFTVVTGPSGSGKSSLLFDTLWAEAQRRYTGSLPAYVRQVLGVWEKPDVDSLTGLIPAVALDARPAGASPRSTVGTVSEVYDYLRILLASAGTPACPKCATELTRTVRGQIIEQLLSLPVGTRITVTAPLGTFEPDNVALLWPALRREGFLRVLVGESIAELDGDPPDLPEPLPIAVVVDRIRLRPDGRQRLAEAVETALRRSDGKAGVLIEGGEPLLFSERFQCPTCGFTAPELLPASFSFNTPHGACPACNGLGVEADTATPCSACEGTRLNPVIRSVSLGEKSLAEIVALPLGQLRRFVAALKLSGALGRILAPIREEMLRRLDLLLQLGLHYLSLDRSVPTLSAGEHQRVRLATQIAAGLSGLLYVLDEPTCGLHPSETEYLVRVLRGLCARGSTVAVVEHDLDLIRQADRVIDLGPGAGPFGGEVVAVGTPAEITRNGRSLTGRFLKQAVRAKPGAGRPGHAGWVELHGVSVHNLKGVSAAIPLQTLTCVTGPSGSGKSTLIVEVLYQALRQHLSKGGRVPARHTGSKRHGVLRLRGALNRVAAVDQSPVGRSARSNPATYTGLFSMIRSFFSLLPTSRMRGWGPERFSFNVKGGRCEVCRGEGVRRVSMQFLPDVVVTCDVCGGSRYNAETLEVKYRGLSIADVLNLTVSEAAEIFANLPRCAEQLRFLAEIGLGYLTLGQRADTLSGGEAQRLKLSRELARVSQHTLYILDEPTTGLHPQDVTLLVAALRRLVEAGNTVVVIEHDMFFVGHADYILDLGPGGGEQGGRIVAAGSPQEVAACEGSLTARYLRRVLA